MKILLLLVLISCGRNNSGRSNSNVYRQGYSTQTVQVGSPSEAISILNTAVRMGRLYDYQGARFYHFNGQYLFTSRVINQYRYEIR